MTAETTAPLEISTYSDYSVAQLRKLTAGLADLIRDKEKAEKAALIARFEKEAQESGFALADLFAGTAHAPTSTPKKAAAPTVPPKYRNPANPAETWTGRGRSPAWVRVHTETGGTLDDLLIK